MSEREEKGNSPNLTNNVENSKTQPEKSNNENEEKPQSIQFPPPITIYINSHMFKHTTTNTN